MSEYINPDDLDTWVCGCCDQPLVKSQVTISYLGSAYPVTLLTCPSCGIVLIPESLALGKMNEVEKALEDK